MWGGLSVGDGAICSSTHLAGGHEPLAVLNDVLWRRLGLYPNYLTSLGTRAFAISKYWRIIGCQCQNKIFLRFNAAVLKVVTKEIIC